MKCNPLRLLLLALALVAASFAPAAAPPGLPGRVAAASRGVTIEEANAAYAKAIDEFNKKQAQLLMDQIKLAQENARLGVDTQLHELNWSLIELDFKNLVNRSKRTSRAKAK